MNVSTASTKSRVAIRAWRVVDSRETATEEGGYTLARSNASLIVDNDGRVQTIVEFMS
jgi:hypothetical protein